jgi:hypothetical protein
MKKNLPLLIVGIAVVGFILGKKTFFKPRPLELPKYGNYLSCMGFPFDLHMKFRSTAILEKASLPEDNISRQRIFYSTAYFQNMYTFTNLHDYNLNTNLKWSSMSDKEPKVTIVSAEDATYPVDIVIPHDTKPSGFLPDTAAYLDKLVQKGKIVKGEPALKITYEYENDIQMCFTENIPDLSKLKIVQPVDPYMAYFVVPLEERKQIANPLRKAEQIVNPCMNPESISASPFVPFYQWFFWRPFAEGHDSNKTAFNCNNYYKENVSIQQVQLTVTENSPKNTAFLAFDKFENLNRPITVSIFMGSQETKVFKKFNKEDAERYIARYLSGIDSQTAKKELPIFENKYDPKFSSYLWLMRNMTEQMEVKISEFDVNDFSAKVTLKGKLKLSRKDIVLKIFLNQNNPRFEGSDHFAKAFADEFLNNDIVIYGGHVNQGNVFAESIEKYGDVMKAKQNHQMSYQILALYSCTAGFFFKGDNFPKVGNDEFQRDVIRTGGGFSDGSANSSLILLGQVDSYLYNKKYAPFAYWSKMAKTDNFYILTNH